MLCHSNIILSRTAHMATLHQLRQNVVATAPRSLNDQMKKCLVVRKAHTVYIPTACWELAQN